LYAILPQAVRTEPSLILATYPLGVGSSPSPAFVNRVFRIRPRVPLDDPQTMTAVVRFKHLPTPDPEALLPVIPAGLIEDPAPALLEKLYRMRPRSGKAGGLGNINISCEPVAAGVATDALTSPLGVEGNAGLSALDALRSLSKNWKTVPMDLKAMVMAVPVLLCLSLVPFGTKQSYVAQASTVEAGTLQKVVTEQLDRVGQEIRGRAAIAVEDDFRLGLDRWSGVDGWRATWSSHPSGWVSPGKLAVLTPSIALKDYRLEFSGQIVSRALGFVVRAADTANYHAVKFTLSTKSPTHPLLTIVRSVVVQGEEVQRKETTIPTPVAPDTVYHVTLDANDQYFTLMIGDKVVDFWSDAQLKSGGIGFFADKGEKALIHDVKVRHQYDALGRLVAAALPAER
jgi:hypothetical protein